MAGGAGHHLHISRFSVGFSVGLFFVERRQKNGGKKVPLSGKVTTRQPSTTLDKILAMCYARGRMFDWFDGLVGYDTQYLDTGKLILLAPGGEVTLMTDRWADAMGSYEEQIRLKPHPSTPDMTAAARKHDFICAPVCFRMQGNPSKFLQGHNVFGPAARSLGPAIRDIFRDLPAGIRPADADDNRWAAVHRMRVDVTTSIRLDSHAAVHEWIQAAQVGTRSKHRQRQAGLAGATTVTWGIGSERWQIVAYCKACEFEKHRPRREDIYLDLKDYVEGLLRIELRLHRKELKDRGSLDESLIWEYFDRIEVGIMKDDIGKAVSELKPSTRKIYLLWHDGHDVSPASGFCKRAMFYRYRKEILEATGQDISLPPSKEKPSVKRDQFSIDYLKAHEEKEVPEQLRKHLYQPEESPTWPAH